MTSDAAKRATLKVAGIVTLVGGVVAIAVNALHPRPPERTEDLLTLVATMPHWTTIHYLAACATPLIVAGLALVVRTLADAQARAWGEVGKYVMLLGAAAFAVAIAIDGYGYPRFARLWLAASGDEKSTILWAAAAVHSIDAALFPVWAGLFLGLGLLLIAAALWRSGEYAAWFAAVGIAGGLMCLVFAASIAFGFGVPLPLWPVGPAIDALWITSLGALLLRRAW
jgi:hypothetical protein